MSHFWSAFICLCVPLQICVWSSDGWEKQKSRFLQLPSGRSPAAQSETRVQFHQDQIHFLVVHETQLAIYETTKLDCIKQVGVLIFFFFYNLSTNRSFLCIGLLSYMLSIISGPHENQLPQYPMQHFLVIASWFMLVFLMELCAYSLLHISVYDAVSIHLLIFLQVSGKFIIG